MSIPITLRSSPGNLNYQTQVNFNESVGQFLERFNLEEEDTTATDILVAGKALPYELCFYRYLTEHPGNRTFSFRGNIPQPLPVYERPTTLSQQEQIVRLTSKLNNTREIALQIQSLLQQILLD